MAKRLNVNKADLKALHTPQPTRTWSPVSHFNVVDQVEMAIEAKGLGVISHRIDLNGKGTYMFGTVVLDTPGTRTSRFMLGYRNSTNKHLAVGFTAGLHITNCSNMSFQGDFMTFQKHTSCLDLPMVYGLATEALGILPKYKQEMDDRLAEYTAVEFQPGSKDFKAVVFDLLKDGIVSPSSFQSFLSALTEEVSDAQGLLSLGAIYNGVTRLNRNNSLEQILGITPRLNRFADDYLARLAA